ncbi:MAG TPA: hypothetical protein VIH88_12565 [Candidatus Acidoferrales bacterium]
MTAPSGTPTGQVASITISTISLPAGADASAATHTGDQNYAVTTDAVTVTITTP